MKNIKQNFVKTLLRLRCVLIKIIAGLQMDTKSYDKELSQIKNIEVENVNNFLIKGLVFLDKDAYFNMTIESLELICQEIWICILRIVQK